MKPHGWGTRVWALVGVVLVMCFLPAGAQVVPPSVPQAEIKTATVEEYRTHLVRLRGLVAACRADAAACDPAKVGSDDRVAAQAGAVAFQIRWSWLWDVILKTKDAKLAGRETLLDEASARLVEQSREAGIEMGQAPAGPAGVTDFKRARAWADKVLAGAEFRHVTKNTYWDELGAKFFAWLGRVFGGVSNLGQSAPWLGPVIMYGFLALALAGLVVWVLRVLDRQRLAVRLESPVGKMEWKEAARNWAKLAEASAAAGEWREAVHSLYWASVTELEGRRVWRQNDARTPREYLRLVQQDAPQYRPMRALTQMLERIWYGLAPAVRRDYDEALAVYEELRRA